MKVGEVGGSTPPLPTLCSSHGHHTCRWTRSTNLNQEDPHGLPEGREQELGGWGEGAPPGAVTPLSSIFLNFISLMAVMPRQWKVSSYLLQTLV
jgi:hypothetical protein